MNKKNNPAERFRTRNHRDFTELEKFFEVQKWINGLSPKENNKKRYLGILDDFVKFTKRSPKELIDEEEEDRKKERREQLEPSKKRIKDYYEYCINELGNSGNSSKWKAFSVIAGFYSRNAFPIKFHKEETPSKSPPVKEKVFKLNGKIESNLKKVLKLLLQNLKTLRDKAILTMMASSGMDMVDLFKLQYKNVKNWLDTDDFVIYEYVREKIKNKTKYPAVTVFTLESLEYLKAYLKQEYPKKKDENGKETSEIDINDDDFVFISLGKEKNNKKQLTQFRFTDEIDRISKSIGINNVTPKSFRRFTNVMLIDSGIESNQRNLWLGHVSEIEDAYDLWSKYPEKIREIYSQAIIYVSIGDGYVKLNSQIEQLDKKLKEQKEEYDVKIKEIEQKLQDFQELAQGELDYLKQRKESVTRGGHLSKSGENIKDKIIDDLKQRIAKLEEKLSENNK